MLQWTNTQRYHYNLGAFAQHEPSDLQKILERMESEKFQAMQHDYLLPFWSLLGDAQKIFQQDNVSCHPSKSIQK